MYYSKYIKYKNKYLYLKYQFGGLLQEPTAILSMPSSLLKPNESPEHSYLQIASKSPKPSDSQIARKSPKPSDLPKPSDSLEQKFFNIEIPLVSENLNDIEKLLKEKSLKENLVGLKVREQNLELLKELGKFKKKFNKNTVYFYR